MGSPCTKHAAPAAAAALPERLEAEPTEACLPESADPRLAEAYTCEVLHTTKGLLKGSWGSFRAEAFYRPLPGDPLRTLRHILIEALNISRYAERAGEAINVEILGEGSYARVFGAFGVAAKVISSSERPWVHKAAVDNFVRAGRLALGPQYYGHGTVEQALGGHFKGTALFMECLDPRGEAWSASDTAAILEQAAKIAREGFHNDLKLDNVLRRRGRPIIIDYDLWSPWTVKVAVTSSCLEHDFQDFLEPRGEEAARNFREYYDLFAFSLTLPDGQLYRSVLDRLEVLWSALEAPVLRPLVEGLGEAKLTTMPFEVLVRVQLQGVTVNLLDLRGNLFVHLPHCSSSQEAIPQCCSRYPQMFKSNGVYWP